MGNFSVVGFDSLGEQFEERGLTVTVSTNNTDSIALIDANGQVVEYPLGREVKK
jgi:hypothetical protein